MLNFNWNTKVNKAGYKRTKEICGAWSNSDSLFLARTYTILMYLKKQLSVHGFDYWLGYDSKTL